MTSTQTRRPRLRPGAEQVLRALSDYCQELQPGDLVPPHQELMRRFDASERAVRWALDELRRQGKIVRRQGARTCVADPSTVSQPDAAGATAIGTRTIVAIAVPDHALFDHAMNMLVEKAEVEDISVACHLLSWDKIRTQALPTFTEEPLGFIVFRRELLGLAEDLQARGHRVVAVGTPYVDMTPGVPAVYGDQEQGGYLATQHLIELGHRYIMFCAEGDGTQSLRWQGHQRALREARKRGLDIADTMISLGEIRSWRTHPERGKALFQGPRAPTGLVIWNDHEAVMVLAQLARLGIRVPQDVSIVGYDNLPEGEIQHPALTTVHSPIDQQLQTAINLLTRPQTPKAPYQLLIQPTLISRESSAAPPSSRSK